MDNSRENKNDDEKIEESISFDENLSDTQVSHSPLDLGSGGTIKVPGLEVPDVKPTIQRVEPVAKKTAEKMVSTDRITGVRTFFTKLHVGAIEFLDEQITNWLKDNPGIIVKRTTVTTGDVAAKKTEPNLIINIWY